jgi:hypothetical protein
MTTYEDMLYRLAAALLLLSAVAAVVRRTRKLWRGEKWPPQS